MITAIVLTAFLSSVLTLVFGYLLYRTLGERRLQVQMDQMQREFEQRVKSGVVAAGQELLPEFRREVAAGFQDALQRSHAAGLAEDTAKVVTGAAGLLESGLSSLLGRKPR